MKNSNIGLTLKELRKRSGLTQIEVINKLNIKRQSTLSTWESGKTEPDAYTFLCLCKLYGVKDIYKTFEFSELSVNTFDDSLVYLYHKADDDDKRIVRKVLNINYEDKAINTNEKDSKNELIS